MITFDDIIRHYRFGTVAAKELGICRATLYVWKTKGVPAERQKQVRAAMRKPKSPQ
jgi:hypothetical protein